MMETQLALAGPADGPPSVAVGATPGPTFANFFYVDLSKNTPEPADDDSFIELDTKAVQKGRMIDEMRSELLTLTGGWPKRVGSKLFARTPDNNVQWLGSASDLFAWIEPQAKVMWKRGEGMVPRDVFYRHLLMTVEKFDLEALITAPVVSGHQMHKGEAQRPNTLIWVLTLNGARLSRDMAQRCIIVKLQRPEYSSTWEAETRAFIETNRWKIISDIGMALTGTIGCSTKEGDSDGAILPMGSLGSSSPGKSGPRRKSSGTRRRKAK